MGIKMDEDNSSYVITNAADTRPCFGNEIIFQHLATLASGGVALAITRNAKDVIIELVREHAKRSVKIKYGDVVIEANGANPERLIKSVMSQLDELGLADDSVLEISAAEPPERPRRKRRAATNYAQSPGDATTAADG